MLENYFIFWFLICLFSLFLCICNFKKISLFQKKYWIFLFQKWKIFTFVCATLFLTLVAPYMHDPTWDYISMPMMAMLTFLTAPWSIGVFYRLFKKQSSFLELFIATIFWMFSVSWSYDLYILLRDGVYPATWLVNIPASSVLYFFAGLFWNVEWNKKHGLLFSFMKKDWFLVEQKFSAKIIYLLLILSGVVLFLLFYGAGI